MGTNTHAFWMDLGQFIFLQCASSREVNSDLDAVEGLLESRRARFEGAEISESLGGIARFSRTYAS